MRHIILVEDEEGVLKYLAHILEKSGYKVSAFMDGNEALEFIKAHYFDTETPPELLITDNKMPNLSGLDLIDAIKDAEINLPSMLVTASEERQTVIEALRKGCYEFIDKPVSGDVLIERVRKTFKKIDAEKKNVAGRSDKIGKYRLIKLLGQGTAGSVFLCEDTELGKRYALKLLRFDNFDSDLKPIAVKRFIHEGDAISQLNHPNVINFVEFSYGDSSSNSSPYIVMEYFEGESLKHILENTPEKVQDIETGVLIIKQVADALASVHAHNILHRDIKPGNILINKEFHVKITDFGVCNLPYSDLTLTSELLGSPAYIAPEYLLHGKADKHADIYSLGVVAYEIFCGRRPFEAENFHQLRYKVINEYPIAPTKLNYRIPEALQYIIGRMLSKNLKYRYSKATDIVEDLNKFEKKNFRLDKLQKLEDFLFGVKVWE